MGGVPSGAAPLGCYTTLPDLRDIATAQFLSGSEDSKDFFVQSPATSKRERRIVTALGETFKGVGESDGNVGRAN
jgi:hypothetical protein